jgi:uncharacterized surface anchored protein
LETKRRGRHPPSAIVGGANHRSRKRADRRDPRREDTSTGKTCTTNASGDCTISNIVPGEYWIVETVTPPGYDSAPDKHVTVTAGHTTSVTLENPRKFKTYRADRFGYLRSRISARRSVVREPA